MHTHIQPPKKRAVRAATRICPGTQYGYVVRDGDNELGVELLIDFPGNYQRTKELFSKVEKYRRIAETEYGKQLMWEPHTKNNRSWVRDNLGTYLDPNGENWQYASERLTDAMRRFSGVFHPILVDLDVGELLNRPRLMEASSSEGITQNAPAADGRVFHGQPSRGTHADTGSDNVGLLIEGATKQIYVDRRERNLDVIRRAKALGDGNCEVCGFSFGDSYGEHGDGFIEAHHTIPLADGLREMEITEANIRSYIRLLCSNCHRMIHRGADTLSVEELKNIWNTQHPDASD